ncbi:hypothetical protein BMS3Bbin03_01196 [bacterium BMS3Bbin03]|nr:hypothetical protein BMS3Bbin03_01196 [bacterium BMS3Bbin03]
MRYCFVIFILIEKILLGLNIEMISLSSKQTLKDNYELRIRNYE